MSWLSFFVGAGLTFILLFIISACIAVDEADIKIEEDIKYISEECDKKEDE